MRPLAVNTRGPFTSRATKELQRRRIIWLSTLYPWSLRLPTAPPRSHATLDWDHVAIRDPDYTRPTQSMSAQTSEQERCSTAPPGSCHVGLGAGAPLPAVHPPGTACLRYTGAPLLGALSAPELPPNSR